MSLEEDVFAALTSGSPALRVYPEVIPEFVQMPVVTFTMIAGTEDFTLAGPTGLLRRLIQVDSWATTRASAYALITQAQALMVSASAFAVNAISESGAPRYEPETRRYRESREFTVWAQA